MKIKKKYKLNIDPKILELLGPSLYTNIYYILAELIANAYDADANNVYIISSEEDIIVEDDGIGMSYNDGDIKKYLDVAKPTRNNSKDSLTKSNRQKMGRKGIGKLAALSVSHDVIIKTISNGEKSGFILSRNIKKNRLLTGIDENQITFQKIKEHGTAIVMKNPKYKLSNDLRLIKRNLLRLFPMVNHEFRIHIIHKKKQEVIDSFDKEIIQDLSTLITLGEDFEYLHNYFYCNFQDSTHKYNQKKSTVSIPIIMKNIYGDKTSYNIEIKGWIGTYLSTRGRKSEVTDFPDNFISLYANNKMGEFNILPLVGQNKLPEVYVVGQLHINIFELTVLPDMALSNRQGYKSDDPRYQNVLKYVREDLLPEILKLRGEYVSQSKRIQKKKKLDNQRKDEDNLRKAMDTFKKDTSKNIINIIQNDIDTEKIKDIKLAVENIINDNSHIIGMKKIVDSQKKRILISQTRADKDLADVIYQMLLFNNIPGEDIIYTNCDDEIARIPESDNGKNGIYDYLRDFFVNSYSLKKIYVIFVTSHNSKKSWGALTEVGAAWITQVEHKIFNIHDFRPEHPLDDEQQWHSSRRDENGCLYMEKLDADIFSQKIEFICNKLGYSVKTREQNIKKLDKLINIK